MVPSPQDSLKMPIGDGKVQCLSMVRIENGLFLSIFQLLVFGVSWKLKLNDGK